MKDNKPPLSTDNPPDQEVPPPQAPHPLILQNELRLLVHDIHMLLEDADPQEEFYEPLPVEIELVEDEQVELLSGENEREEFDSEEEERVELESGNDEPVQDQIEPVPDDEIKNFPLRFNNHHPDDSP